MYGSVERVLAVCGHEQSDNQPEYKHIILIIIKCIEMDAN